MEIDLSLAHNYTVNTDVWLPPCPGSVDLYYYPGASTVKGRDGMLLEIVPDDGKAWLGMFAEGGNGGLSGIYSHPDGRSICVISSGRCYFVRTDDPQKWREKTEAIRQVKTLPDHNMLILSDRKSLIAYGAHGFLWKTEGSMLRDLTQDLAIEAIEGNTLHCRVLYTGKTQKGVDFYISLVTGEYKSRTGR